MKRPKKPKASDPLWKWNRYNKAMSNYKAYYAKLKTAKTTGKKNSDYKKPS